MSKTIRQLTTDLQRLSNARQKNISQRFFKTGAGQYGAGDIFLGITVPMQRGVAKKYHDLPLADVQILLNSSTHEHRLTGLLILINQYQRADSRGQTIIFNFCLKNSHRINNWDLVDTVAPAIIGNYLLDRPRIVLYRLAKSHNLWQRRIAIVATYTFIKNNDVADTLRIAQLLLNDHHDLIHKAVGWMLREVGKRNQAAEEKFLLKHYQKMPRTMLRYAIERWPEKKRKQYLKGEV